MVEPQEGPTPPDAPKQCAACSSTGEELKRCGRCLKVEYCNKECQTAHWKTHKKECSRLAGESEQPSSSRNDSKPFTAISEGNFLHDRSEDETYKLLVDIVRMLQEDTYRFEGGTMPGTIYNGGSSSIPAFRAMLRRAEAIDGFLPPWWTAAKEAECIRRNSAALAAAQEKSDIQEAWGDQWMPMKLRMLGEQIWGKWPGVAPHQTESMLRFQMAKENGEGTTLALDHANMSIRRGETPADHSHRF
ncbi:hypothetical protein CBER1_01673 [Cercospora berteroae]|uniref:MYND-type domain-containing protein n=1 Tax=Cercospora berteroae TaxID=357750 RepID=A0A2S6CH47_9PEZI|nr:hypothetical protein CBER1_01673 [Cercospora berteroae]